MEIAGPERVSGVEAVIRRAAGATGVDFGFLMKTARRESGLDPQARAKTSSATGLFQFVDQTWLQALKRFGPRHGFGAAAAAIETGADGRLHVAEAGARRAVLGLRLDPRASALMAGEMTAEHAAYLKGRTGRDPTAADLYAAHFLGAGGSARLIEAVQSRPAAPAASLFPEAAQANHAVFYHEGRARSVQEVYAALGRIAGDGDRPVSASGPEKELLSERELALAQRLDRVQRDRALLDVMSSRNGSGLLQAQLLGAFAPASDS